MFGASNGVHVSDALQWKVGLVNCNNKYLTAETFGFKINASGSVMRKKQLWVIEHDTKEEDVVYIKSHLNRYLSGDKKGNVTCENEEQGEFEKFCIDYHPTKSGLWAFRSKATGYYFGGTEDMLKVYEKSPTDSEWWTVHLAIHPQATMQNVNRKRYAHYHTENNQIQVDELIPWGPEALITLEFTNGKYAVKTCTNQYLRSNGELASSPGADTLFSLEIRSGANAGMALRDHQGKYLTAIGANAVMKSSKKTISKDELFRLQDSHPQVFFTAHNGKKVSIKQGIDLTANQDDLSESETFQVEYIKADDAWRIRTAENKYWSLEDACGIQGKGNNSSGTGLFSIEWLENGAITLKASNGRYVTARQNGSLYAVSETPSDKDNFFITLINRPILVLKCDFGFIGFKSPSNPRIECNKANFDPITLEHTNGQSVDYYLKGHNGKYFAVDGEGMINADSSEPQPFRIVLTGLSKFAIQAPNGTFLKGEQNGIVRAKSTDMAGATLWEY